MARSGIGESEGFDMRRHLGTRRYADDSGMSIIEVVVASFILFFVLTAVLGLIGATTKSSISAKQRTAMTNAISSYIEYVRSLPFNQVELSSEDASGLVAPQVTVDNDGFTVTLTNTLNEGQYGLKELQIQAVCNAQDPSYPALHTSAFVAIRDRLRSANELGQPHSGGPVIQFGHLTPAENSILFSNNVDGGGTAYVDASVVCTGGVIQTVEFRVGDQRLRNSYTPSADEAYWTPGTASAYESIIWDTGQVRGASSEKAVRDGWRIVRILATDELGRQTFKDRRFLIDNFAPADPGQATGAPRTDVTTLVTWPKSMDGSDPAVGYTLEAWKEGMDANWSTVGSFSLSQPAHTLTTTTFGRYWVRVQALSPRGLQSNWVSCVYPFVAKPLLTGSSTCSITGSGPSAVSNVTVSLNYPAPAFPVSAVRYDLYRGTSATALTLYRSAIAEGNFTETIAQSIGGSVKVPTAYYYQLQVTYTPSGWPYDYAQKTSVSNVVGPTPITNGGATTFVPIW